MWLARVPKQCEKSILVIFLLSTISLPVFMWLGGDLFGALAILSIVCIFLIAVLVSLCFLHSRKISKATDNIENKLHLTALVTIIFFIYVVYKAFVFIENGRYFQDEKKPFWEGISEVLVCRVPYYSSNECLVLKAGLLEDNKVRIQIEGGVYIINTDLTCYRGGVKPKSYVFCRSWDDNYNQWDLFPSWIRF